MDILKGYFDEGTGSVMLERAVSIEADRLLTLSMM